MGLFSGLWKGIKSIFGGIMKVFAPILEPLAKALNTGIGKAIMIGLAIFTLGTALIAGAGAFGTSMAAGNGFISSFVTGAGEFMGTLLGTSAAEGAGGGVGQGASQVDKLGQMNQVADAAGAALETGAIPGLQGVGTAGEVAAEAAAAGGGMGGGIAAAGGSGGGTIGATQGASQASKLATMNTANSVATTGSAGSAAGNAGNWLSKAKDMGSSFVKGAGEMLTDPNTVGKLVEGAGNYYIEKDRQEFEDRVRRQWGDPNDAGIKSMRDTNARVGRLQGPSAQGIAQQSRTTARNDGQRPQFALPINTPAGG
jgi:hypothetical protein